MLHFTPFLTVLAFSFADPVVAQPGGFQDDDIEGVYFHQGSGDRCRVYRKGRSYIFENEKGSQARFTYFGPGELRIVESDGGWHRSMRVLVNRSRFGQVTLRFETPRGYVDQWRSAR